MSDCASAGLLAPGTAARLARDRSAGYPVNRKPREGLGGAMSARSSEARPDATSDLNGSQQKGRRRLLRFVTGGAVLLGAALAKGISPVVAGAQAGQGGGPAGIEGAWVSNLA